MKYLKLAQIGDFRSSRIMAAGGISIQIGHLMNKLIGLDKNRIDTAINELPKQRYLHLKPGWDQMWDLNTRQ